MEAITLESVVNFLSTIFTSVLGWFGDVFTLITENPLLLVIVAIPIVYGIFRSSIGVIRKLGLRSR